MPPPEPKGRPAGSEVANHEGAVRPVTVPNSPAAAGGSEFLGRVKELYPETIRIILSGDSGLETVLDSINRGAIYRFYTKPWDDAELRENIRLAFHHYWLLHRSHPPGGLAPGAHQVRFN